MISPQYQSPSSLFSSPVGVSEKKADGVSRPLWGSTREESARAASRSCCVSSQPIASPEVDRHENARFVALDQERHRLARLGYQLLELDRSLYRRVVDR